MKYSSRNRAAFFWLILLGLLAGTLAWDLLERVLSYAGVVIDLGIGPVGFDIHVLALTIYLNPGTLLGGAGGWVLFRRL